jgi:transposase
MLALSSSNRFHLYLHPTDMRKSFDGLSGLVTEFSNSKPLSGDVFVFVNRRRDKIKLLQWQGMSFTLYYKRLEEGTFEMPVYDSKADNIELDYTQMVMLIDGLSIKNIKKRKRYNPNF